jgi:hypothetical protein
MRYELRDYEWGRHQAVDRLPADGKPDKRSARRRLAVEQSIDTDRWTGNMLSTWLRKERRLFWSFSTEGTRS